MNEIHILFKTTELMLVDDILTLQAAQIIKEYCNKHAACENCIFFNKKLPLASCVLMMRDCGDSIPPCEWRIGEEVND